MATRSLIGQYEGTVSGTTHTDSVTLAAGTRRKIVVMVLTKTESDTTGVTFNGTAMTNVPGASIDHSATNHDASTWYYDVSDGTGAGSYDVVATISAASANVSVYTYQLDDVATGTAEDADEIEWTSTSTNATLTLTCTDGAVLIGGAVWGDAAGTWTYTGDVTEDGEGNETNYTSAVASAVVSGAGSKAVTATVSISASAFKLLVATSWTAQNGPAITTQPTAQTARINGEAAGPIATFTVAATSSGGTLVYDWELEDGVASGVYANVADGSGATWTGATGTSLVGTFTATTLTGRRVRCNVTDDNGTVTTNAVALTVLAGPVTTASDSVTNGSGVGTLTYHSDDALTTNGELLLWTVTSRGRSFYLVTRPS